MTALVPPSLSLSSKEKRGTRFDFFLLDSQVQRIGILEGASFLVLFLVTEQKGKMGMTPLPSL